MNAAKFLTIKPSKAAKTVLLATVLVWICLLFYYYRDIGSRYKYYTPASSIPRPLPFFRQGPEPWWREVVCKRAGHWYEEPGTPLRHLLKDVTPEKDNNVFLMETSCNSRPKSRVWCSVESWARQNPSHQVWFLFISGGLAQTELPRVLLQQYTNLHAVDVDLDDLFGDTPLVPFFNSRKWTRENTWPVELLSDMLRVLVLWRWGGVYSDTDVMSIRPLTLPLNALGFENPQQLASASYSFQARHPILLELMEDMQENFSPRQWGSIGPLAISRVVSKTCGKDLPALCEQAPVECPGNLTLYPQNTFSPIYFRSYEKYFSHGGGEDFHKMFNATFTLHFWNHLSKRTEVKVNSNSIYEVAAKNFCPLTYQIATADSDVF